MSITEKEDRAMTEQAQVSRKTVTILAVILAVVVAGVAVVAALVFVRPTSRQPITVMGVMEVPWSTAGMTDLPVRGGACVADDGYDDIDQGTQVSVKDNDGHTVGLGELGAGTFQPIKGDKTGLLYTCSFPFSVTVNPDGSDYYSVEVGHRGALQYTADRLESPLQLTLG